MRQIEFVHHLMGCKEHIIASVVFLPKILPPQAASNHEDTSNKLKLRLILQSNWPVIFKSQGKKHQERLRN